MIYLILGINIFSFILMGIDKYKAIKIALDTKGGNECQ